jgi:hypothetical protein
MSHYRTLYIDVEGTTIEFGRVRITNDDEVLSIYVFHLQRLFLPGDV